MVGGVTCIPIPGEWKHPPSTANADLALPHFVCGPENRLIQSVIESILAFSASEKEPTTGLETTSHSNDNYCLRSSIPNPILFTGPTGCGKTHILEGLVTTWRSRFGKNAALYTTAVDFRRRLAEAGDAATRTEIRKAFRTRSLLAIDDLERLPRRAAVAEEFINSIDAIDRQGGLLLMASIEPPGRLANLLPALRSRLSKGLVVSLAMPDHAARRTLTEHFLERRGITLSEQQVNTLTGTALRSPRAITHRLAHWEFTSSHKVGHQEINQSGPTRRPIGVVECLSTPSLRMITSVVGRTFSLRQSDLRGKSRRHSIVYARGVAMYLARELTDQSFAKIGTEFGGRDHSTVLHACRKITDLTISDVETRSIVAKLRRLLQSS